MEQSPLIDIGLPIALFIIMVGIGLTLRSADFQREAKAPRGAITGSLAQLVAMPLLGYGIAVALGLSPALTIGLVIVAACPGGTTSNLIAHLARANVALSIVLTVVASIVTIITLPLAANLAVATQPISDLGAIEVPLTRSVGLLVAIVLIPVTLGMVLRQKRPELAERLERPLSGFGALVLVGLIVGIAIDLREDLVQLLIDAGPAAALLNIGGIAIGLGLGALVGLARADRLTFAVELGVKNSTLGILIAVTVIGNETMAVPAGVYSLLMYATGAGLVAWGRRTRSPEPTPV